MCEEEVFNIEQLPHGGYALRGSRDIPRDGVAEPEETVLVEAVFIETLFIGAVCKESICILYAL